jgi:hypothetical protein
MNGRGLLWAAGVVVGGALVTWWLDRYVRTARSDGDSEGFWTTIACGVGWLGAAHVVSRWIESGSDRWWQSGIHLQFDLVCPEDWAYPSALGISVACWAGLVAWQVGVVGVSASRPRVFGSCSDVVSRRWVLCFAIIPIQALLLGALRLDQGVYSFPAGTWAMLVLFTLSVIALGLSVPADPDGVEEADAGVLAGDLDRTEPEGLTVTWERGMAMEGVQLREIAAWEATPHTAALDPSAERQYKRMTRSDVGPIAPDVLNAVAKVQQQTDDGAAVLVLAPDGCGQLEVVVDTAQQQYRRAGTATLVIVPRLTTAVIESFARWVPGAEGLATLRQGDGLPGGTSWLWLIDAQGLSDWGLTQFSASTAVQRLGGLVWWDLHAYTGVYAANVWALSRRLHRITEALVRPEMRTFVFMRSPSSADAQGTAFVRRMLPYTFGKDRVVTVSPTFAQDVRVYLWEGHDARFADGAHASEPEAQYRDALLVAAHASTSLGWSTVVDPPPGLTDGEVQTVYGLRVSETRRLGEVVTGDAAGSEVRIRSIADAEVLALPRMVMQGGRRCRAKRGHHVLVRRPTNPYAAYWIEQGGWQAEAGPADRRLVAAQGQPEIVERHLMAALYEREGTTSDLARSMLLKTATVERTLDRLYRRGDVSRTEVRRVTPSGELHREYAYKSRLPNPTQPRPLDCVGRTLIEVCEPGVAETDEQVRLRVDRERVTMQAYPGRVFVADGGRYRIEPWTAAELAAGTIRCQPESRWQSTWRIRRSAVTELKVRPGTTPAILEHGGQHLLTRMSVTVQYRETVEGVRVHEEIPATQGVDQRTLHWVEACGMEAPFATSALVLGINPAPDPAVAAALALALAYVIPVHVGIEEAALEVVPLQRRLVDGGGGAPIDGVALVDLYPSGVGFVEALEVDDPLIRKLLTEVYRWLGDRAGQEALTQAPLAHCIPASRDYQSAVQVLGHWYGGEA